MRNEDFIDTIFAGAGRYPLSGNSVICRENDNGARLKEVTVVNLPAGSLVMKLEHIALNHLVEKRGVEKKWGFNQHSDYVIATSDKCVFIEMKSNPRLGYIIDETIVKFVSDNCLVNYADSIFSELCGKNGFFSNRESHYVLFYAAPDGFKPPVGPLQKNDNLTPKELRPIPLYNCSRIDFNDLI